MNVNIELYKIFCCVAKNKSMTKASVELMISQPAITKSIRTLENQLGGTLFIRSNKGLELTPEGNMIYDKAIVALNILQDTEDEFFEYRELNKGEIKIGVSAVLTKILLLDKIKLYKEKYPNIKITIINGLTSDLISELNKGKLDFVVFNDGKVENNSIELKLIKTLEYCFAYNGNVFDEIKTIDALKNYPFIVQKSGSYTRNFLNEYLKRKKITVDESIEVVSHELVYEFVKNGFGIGFVYKNMISENDDMIKTVDDDLMNEVFLGINKNISPTFASKKFIELLK